MKSNGILKIMLIIFNFIHSLNITWHYLTFHFLKTCLHLIHRQMSRRILSKIKTFIVPLQQANLRAIQLHIIDKRHRCIICIWIAFCKLFFHYLVFFIYINVFFQGFISSSFFDVSDVVIDIIGKREEKKA